YDPHERTLSPALPYLFQRQRAGGRVAPSQPGVQGQLDRAIALTKLRDNDGQPVRFTPHDFRRIFATEAVNGGLPLHIAAKLLGHLDLNTTRGYTAVYDDEVIGHYQQHLARRRAARPSDEYRQPTPQEWADFEQHFRKRKMALGDCYRPYGTSCPHEHACIRCPMLRMDPAQLPRLLQIERNTEERLEEARHQHFLGEAEALELDLQHIGEKKAQVERIRGQPTTKGPPLLSDELELTHSHRELFSPSTEKPLPPLPLDQQWRLLQRVSGASGSRPGRALRAKRRLHRPHARRRGGGQGRQPRHVGPALQQRPFSSVSAGASPGAGAAEAGRTTTPGTEARCSARGMRSELPWSLRAALPPGPRLRRRRREGLPVGRVRSPRT
ncbi:MAG: site-specific integrase, partial [Actinomycetota bacterium]|nr:site-specific integrase [Actinomycetota bacterium]